MKRIVAFILALCMVFCPINFTMQLINMPHAASENIQIDYTVEDTLTPTPIPTDTPTPELTPTFTPESTPTFTPTPELIETPTPQLTDTPTPELTPTLTPEPTETPTLTPEPTETPTETPTPEPTPTLTPEPVNLTINKTLVGSIWHVRCDVMDGTSFKAGGGYWKTDVIKNPTGNTGKEGHRSNKCGNADNWVIWVDANGIPYRMDEVNSGVSGKTLQTIVYRPRYNLTKE